MPNLDRFFEGCEIPHYVWRNAQEDSKIEPAEIAEYLQAGFERLNIGKFFKSMPERHPQMYASFHNIQLHLPENNQVRQLHHLIHLPPITLL